MEAKYEVRDMTLGELAACDVRIPSYTGDRFDDWRARHEKEYIRRCISGIFPGEFLLGATDDGDDGDGDGESYLILNGRKRLRAIERYMDDPAFLADGIVDEAMAMVYPIVSGLSSSKPQLLIALRSAVKAAFAIFDRPSSMPPHTLSSIVRSSNAVEIDDEAARVIDRAQEAIMRSNLDTGTPSIADMHVPVTVVRGGTDAIIETYMASAGILDKSFVMQESMLLRCYWSNRKVVLGEGAGNDKLLDFVCVHYDNLANQYRERYGQDANTAAANGGDDVDSRIEGGGKGGSGLADADRIAFDEAELRDRREVTMYELACSIAGIVISNAETIRTKMFATPERLEDKSSLLGSRVIASVFGVNPTDRDALLTELPNMVEQAAASGSLGEMVAPIEDVSRELNAAFDRFIIVPATGPYCEILNIDPGDGFCPQAFAAFWHSMYDACTSSGALEISAREDAASKERLARQVIHLGGYYLSFILGVGYYRSSLGDFYRVNPKTGYPLFDFSEPVDWDAVQPRLDRWYDSNIARAKMGSDAMAWAPSTAIVSIFTCAAANRDVMVRIGEGEDGRGVEFEFAPVFQVPERAATGKGKDRRAKLANLFANWYLCPKRAAELLESRESDARSGGKGRKRKVTSAWMAVEEAYPSEDREWIYRMLEEVRYPAQSGDGVDRKGSYESVRADILKGRYRSFERVTEARAEYIRDNLVPLMRAKEQELTAELLGVDL